MSRQEGMLPYSSKDEIEAHYQYLVKKRHPLGTIIKVLFPLTYQDHTWSTLLRHSNISFKMAYIKWLKFCVRQGFIIKIEADEFGNPLKSVQYRITEDGRKVLELFKEKT